MSNTTCPICSNKENNQLLKLSCGNFDNSLLYDPVVVITCHGCGHIFNKLSMTDKTELITYYDTEYSLNNLNSPNLSGDLPGSSNTNSLTRYSLLFDFIQKYINKTDKILDIGCATGGFLRFLKDKDYRYLHGIDSSTPYMEKAIKDKNLDIKKGFAESIPYDRGSFNFITADQVVEHLVDPNQIFIETRRVLKPEGLLCISLPNAMLYDQNYFFDFYWFLMREHIQHFDLFHLSAIAKKHGFILINSTTTTSNMSSDKTILPNLSVLFQLGTPTVVSIEHECFNLKNETQKYIKHCYNELDIKKKKIDNIRKQNLPLYIFGISREFFYLYKNTSLSKCNILGLVDDTPSKQEFSTVNGKRIINRSVLKNSTDYIIITAFAHTNKIKEVLKELNFKGEIIEL